MLRNDMIESLVRSIVNYHYDKIALLFEKASGAKEFRIDLKKKLDEVPQWLLGLKRVDNVNQLSYTFTIIHFITSPLRLKGNTYEAVYIVGDMNPGTFEEYKNIVAPLLSQGAEFDYFYLFDI
jgi:hypothetical protein